jgi:putative ABC transport system permease protein
MGTHLYLPSQKLPRQASSRFALRAIGSTSGYIHKVILCKALISAAIGFSIAALAGILTMALTAEAVLPVVVTMNLLAMLLALTVVMCVVSAPVTGSLKVSV